MSFVTFTKLNDYILYLTGETERGREIETVGRRKQERARKKTIRG